MKHSIEYLTSGVYLNMCTKHHKYITIPNDAIEEKYMVAWLLFFLYFFSLALSVK